MRVAKRQNTEEALGDMTPMIDMTFQLIAFFMVLINFSEAEQDDRIQLPASELAKPPEVPFESQITLQLTKPEGAAGVSSVIFSGRKVPVKQISVPLNQEKSLLLRRNMTPADATIIIRADKAAQTGVVQELIKECQDVGFEKFALCAMQEERKT